MDLTKEYPRSVQEKIYGVVQLPRTIDKGKAVAHGNVGDYHYNCGMDQAVFAFLGIDHEATARRDQEGKIGFRDRGVRQTVRREEVARRTRSVESRVANLEAGRGVARILPETTPGDRTDADGRDVVGRSLDLDEKRPVARREPASGLSGTTLRADRRIRRFGVLRFSVSAGRAQRSAGIWRRRSRGCSKSRSTSRRPDERIPAFMRAGRSCRSRPPARFRSTAWRSR